MEARAERVKLLLARVREHVVHILLHILMSGGRMTAYTHNNVTVAHFTQNISLLLSYYLLLESVIQCPTPKQ